MDASWILRGMARTVWIAIMGATMLISAPSVFAKSDDAIADNSADALYLKIRPDFIVNLKGGDRTGFLMLSAAVRGHDAQGIAAVDRHMSAIRHHLLMLLSEKTITDMTTPQGKEATRKQVLAAVQDLLESETGKPGITDVLFTDIIVE